MTNKNNMNDNNFFNEPSYKIPTTSNYMKLQQGENTFRVMSSAINGWEYFTNDNKPIRSKETPEEVHDMKAGGTIKHFWAFVVWNYQAKRLQIFEITQKTIMSPLLDLINNPKWGHPKGYDITITRKGTGMSDTEYSIFPTPHIAVDEDIAKAFDKAKINLEALYEGLDPFTVDKN